MFRVQNKDGTLCDPTAKGDLADIKPFKPPLASSPSMFPEPVFPPKGLLFHLKGLSSVNHLCRSLAWAGLSQGFQEGKW